MNITLNAAVTWAAKHPGAAIAIYRYRGRLNLKGKGVRVGCAKCVDVYGDRRSVEVRLDDAAYYLIDMQF
jgi:hypothetical protein